MSTTTDTGAQPLYAVRYTYSDSPRLVPFARGRTTTLRPTFNRETVERELARYSKMRHVVSAHIVEFDATERAA